MQENSRDVAGEAMRRSLATGTSFRHAMRRETLRRQRQIEAGKLIPTDTVEEIVKDEIKAPQISDGISGETQPTPPPVAETPAAPEQGASTTKTKAAKTSTPKTKKAKSEPVAAETTPPAAETAALPTDTTTDTHLDAAYQEKCKNIGRRVTWTAFGTAYQGAIAHVIPVGVTPRSQNIAAGGDRTPARDHLSYVVKKDDGSLVWPALKDLSVVA